MLAKPKTALDTTGMDIENGKIVIESDHDFGVLSRSSRQYFSEARLLELRQWPATLTTLETTAFMGSLLTTVERAISRTNYRREIGESALHVLHGLADRGLEVSTELSVAQSVVESYRSVADLLPVDAVQARLGRSLGNG